MEPDEIGLAREEAFRERQRLTHSRIRGEKVDDFRGKYLAIRDREALLRYEDLKAENARSHAAKTFERPRKPERPNRRLRIWINLLIIAMVLAVLFFSVITPRLTPTHGDAVQESDSEPPLREPLP